MGGMFVIALGILVAVFHAHASKPERV